jgi:large subunit ribosomal protein L35
MAAAKESQMPKLKTKSGAKKRFKVTAGGKVLYQQSHKRHGMDQKANPPVARHLRAVQDRRRQDQKILFAQRLTGQLAAKGPPSA